MNGFPRNIQFFGKLLLKFADTDLFAAPAALKILIEDLGIKPDLFSINGEDPCIFALDRNPAFTNYLVRTLTS